MKQLKRKLQLEIEREENEKEKKKQARFTSLQTYFWPLITFISGAYTTGKNANDLVAFGIVAIFILAGLIWTKYFVTDIYTQINGNILYRKKRLLLYLQDLIDRDFIILDTDIL